MLLDIAAFVEQDKERSEEWLVNRYQGLSLTGFTWSFVGVCLGKTLQDPSLALELPREKNEYVNCLIDISEIMFKACSKQCSFDLINLEAQLLFATLTNHTPLQ